jgi:hypothetical protein
LKDYVVKFEDEYQYLKEIEEKYMTKEYEAKEVHKVEVDHLKILPGIPDFWFTALINCELFEDLI